MNLDALNTTLNRAIHASGDLLRLVDIAQAGLHVATEAEHAVELQREVAEVLGKPDPFPDPTVYEEAKHSAQEVEAFARRERESGFPSLYGLATVRLWTILEIMVEDIVALVLQEPDLLADQQLVQRLEGPLLSFVRASQVGRAEYLADRLRAEVKAPLKPGVGRFEALLANIRLCGRPQLKRGPLGGMTESGGRMFSCTGAVRQCRATTLVLLALCGAACHSWHTERVTPEAVLATHQPAKLRVTCTDGSRIVLKQPLLRGDTLVGIGQRPREQRDMRIALSNVQQVATRRLSVGRTVGLVGLGVVVAAGVLGAIPIPHPDYR